MLSEAGRNRSLPTALFLPPLDDVRPAVRREWTNARRLEAEQKLYASLRGRYEIVIEQPQAKATEAASR
jgi:hypothetical protein